MEVKDDEINLIDLWQVVWKRRYLIIAFTLVSAILVAIVSLLLPKVYEGEAVISLPKGSVNTAEAKPLISAPEAKAVLNSLLKDIKNGASIDGFDADLVKKIYDIKFDQVKGSESQLNLVVQVKDDPKQAKEACNKIIEYLQNNDFVKKKINTEKVMLESKLSYTRKVLERAEKIRDEVVRSISTRSIVGFNPIDVEVSVSKLNSEIRGMETTLSLQKGYEFVSAPHVYNKPVKPKTTKNAIVAGILGLFAGVLFSFIVDTVNNKRTLKV